MTRDLAGAMVLPVRIELTTSALPRMRSTTELRQLIALRERRGYGRSPEIMSSWAMAKRDEEREKRLAAALRENLKRRKAQARVKAGEKGSEPSPG
jgi:hypothetical protein